MQSYVSKSSGNALVIVLVVVFVLALAGGGAYLFFSSREKGAGIFTGSDDSDNDGDADEEGDEEETGDSSSDDEGTTSQVPVDPDNPVDETIVGEDAVSVVIFDGSSFSPSSVDVFVGGKVIFKNESNKNFWPAVDPHPIHTDLPGFDAGEPVGAGQSITFTFSKVGEWDYHNHLNSGQRGTVVVKSE